MGLIARGIEDAGIPTVGMSSAHDITSLVKPPRTFFLDYPLGHQAGKPLDRQNQMAVIRAALGGAGNVREAGAIVVLPFPWEDA